MVNSGTFDSNAIGPGDRNAKLNSTDSSTTTATHSRTADGGGGGGGGDDADASAPSKEESTPAAETPNKNPEDAATVGDEDDGEDKGTLCCSVPLDKVQDVLPTIHPHKCDPAPKPTRKLLDSKRKEMVRMTLLCLYCERSFASANLRQKHVERVHCVKKNRRLSARRQNQLTVTPCVYCEKLNASENTFKDLFQHLIDEHSNKYFGCLPCEERFLTNAQLSDHNASQHPTSSAPEIADKAPAARVGEGGAEGAGAEKAVTVKLTRSKTKSPRTDPADNPERAKKAAAAIRSKNAKLKELRSKKLTVKSSRIALNRRESKRLQAISDAQQKKKRQKAPERGAKQASVGGKPEPAAEKPGGCINPYPEFDNFYRVKKITDHSIDNLKISSLTFDDVFDKTFFNRIKCNIEENLLHHIDGKLFKNEESESRISNFEKVSTQPPEVPNAAPEHFGCELSLNAVTPVASLSLSSQFGEDFESQIEYGSKPSKKKAQTKKDEVHYKYFTRRKFQASILEQTENRDLSKLDMWTQLVIKKRQQKIIDDKKTAKEIQEYITCDEYINKIRREELNRILDRRGPFEDLREEASKKAALDKLNSDSEDNISHESFTEVREVLNEILNRVFAMTEQVEERIEEKVTTAITTTTTRSQTPIDTKQDLREIPSFLNLRRSSSLSNDGEIDQSDKITLICSSQETENFELPTNKARGKNELIELSGEWARCRMYICAACGAKLPNMRYLLDHKTIYHQNVWVQHYEFVGNQSELYRHLSIPILGKVGYVEDNVQCKTWKRSDARNCTKCAKQCNTLGELHRHILECGGDWTWMLARKKCKYRYGAKSRRKRRGLVLRVHHHKRKTDPTEKKKYKYDGPRQRPSDAETIQRMLANLPAKRSTRKLISLYDGVRRRRKNKELEKVKQKKVKCGKVIYSKSSNIKETTEKTINTAVPHKPQKSSQSSNIRSLRSSLNRVLSSRILDTNTKLSVKRKLKVLNERRRTRQTALAENTKKKKIANKDGNTSQSSSSPPQTRKNKDKAEVVNGPEATTPKRTSPRSSKIVRKLTVKKLLNGNINIKSFFPVKKRKDKREAKEEAAVAEKNVDIQTRSKKKTNEQEEEAEEEKERTEKKNEKVEKKCEKATETREKKSDKLSNLVRSLSANKKKNSKKASQEEIAQKPPETEPTPPPPAPPQKKSSNKEDSELNKRKRKLKQSFRNVINRVKRLKIDNAPEKVQTTDKNQTGKSPFLDEAKQEKDPVKIVIPSTIEAKENIADISETAHTVIAFNETNEDSPVPENIFKLDSNNEKHLQAKCDSDLDSQPIAEQTPETKRNLPAVEDRAKLQPISIETSVKPKVVPMISPNMKGKIRKPARGLNDCIAMLTSKLQQKTVEIVPKPICSELLPAITSPRIVTDPSPQKSECILKIPTFKTHNELLEDVALDLSIKSRNKDSDVPLSLTKKPVLAKEHAWQFNRLTSVERIIENVVNNRLQESSQKFTLPVLNLFNSIDQTIQNVIDGHLKTQHVKPLQTRTSVDDIIDYVINFGASQEDNNNQEINDVLLASPLKPKSRANRKIGSIRKLHKNETAPSTIHAKQNEEIVDVADNKGGVKDALTDYPILADLVIGTAPPVAQLYPVDRLSVTKEKVMKVAKKIGQMRKSKSKRKSDKILIETHVDGILDTKEIVNTMQVPIEPDDTNASVANEDEPHILENKTVVTSTDVPPLLSASTIAAHEATEDRSVSLQNNKQNLRNFRKQTKTKNSDIEKTTDDTHSTNNHANLSAAETTTLTDNEQVITAESTNADSTSKPLKSKKTSNKMKEKVSKKIDILEQEKEKVSSSPVPTTEVESNVDKEEPESPESKSDSPSETTTASSVSFKTKKKKVTRKLRFTKKKPKRLDALSAEDDKDADTANELVEEIKEATTEEPSEVTQDDDDIEAQIEITVIGKPATVDNAPADAALTETETIKKKQIKSVTKKAKTILRNKAVKPNPVLQPPVLVLNNTQKENVKNNSENAEELSSSSIMEVVDESSGTSPEKETVDEKPSPLKPKKKLRKTKRLTQARRKTKGILTTDSELATNEPEAVAIEDQTDQIVVPIPEDLKITTQTEAVTVETPNTETALENNVDLDSQRNTPTTDSKESSDVTSNKDESIQSYDAEINKEPKQNKPSKKSQKLAKSSNKLNNSNISSESSSDNKDSSVGLIEKLIMDESNALTPSIKVPTKKVKPRKNSIKDVKAVEMLNVEHSKKVAPSPPPAGETPIEKEDEDLPLRLTRSRSPKKPITADKPVEPSDADKDLDFKPPEEVDDASLNSQPKTPPKKVNPLRKSLLSKFAEVETPAVNISEGVFGKTEGTEEVMVVETTQDVPLKTEEAKVRVTREKKSKQAPAVDTVLGENEDTKTNIGIKTSPTRGIFAKKSRENLIGAIREEINCEINKTFDLLTPKVDDLKKSSKKSKSSKQLPKSEPAVEDVTTNKAEESKISLSAEEPNTDNSESTVRSTRKLKSSSKLSLSVDNLAAAVEVADLSNNESEFKSVPIENAIVEPKAMKKSTRRSKSLKNLSTSLDSLETVVSNPEEIDSDAMKKSQNIATLVELETKRISRRSKSLKKPSEVLGNLNAITKEYILEGNIDETATVQQLEFPNIEPNARRSKSSIPSEELNLAGDKDIPVDSVNTEADSLPFEPSEELPVGPKVKRPSRKSKSKVQQKIPPVEDETVANKIIAIEEIPQTNTSESDEKKPSTRSKSPKKAPAFVEELNTSVVEQTLPDKPEENVSNASSDLSEMLNVESTTRKSSRKSKKSLQIEEDSSKNPDVNEHSRTPVPLEDSSSTDTITVKAASLKNLSISLENLNVTTEGFNVIKFNDPAPPESPETPNVDTKTIRSSRRPKSVKRSPLDNFTASIDQDLPANKPKEDSLSPEESLAIDIETKVKEAIKRSRMLLLAENAAAAEDVSCITENQSVLEVSNVEVKKSTRRPRSPKKSTVKLDSAFAAAEQDSPNKIASTDNSMESEEFGAKLQITKPNRKTKLSNETIGEAAIVPNKTLDIETDTTPEIKSIKFTRTSKSSKKSPSDNMNHDLKDAFSKRDEIEDWLSSEEASNATVEPIERKQTRNSAKKSKEITENDKSEEAAVEIETSAADDKDAQPENSKEFNTIDDAVDDALFQNVLVEPQIRTTRSKSPKKSKNMKNNLQALSVDANIDVPMNETKNLTLKISKNLSELSASAEDVSKSNEECTLEKNVADGENFVEEESLSAESEIKAKTSTRRTKSLKKSEDSFESSNIDDSGFEDQRLTPKRRSRSAKDKTLLNEDSETTFEEANSNECVKPLTRTVGRPRNKHNKTESELLHDSLSENHSSKLNDSATVLNDLGIRRTRSSTNILMSSNESLSKLNDSLDAEVCNIMSESQFNTPDSKLIRSKRRSSSLRNIFDSPSVTESSEAESLTRQSLSPDQKSRKSDRKSKNAKPFASEESLDKLDSTVATSDFIKPLKRSKLLKIVNENIANKTNEPLYSPISESADSSTDLNCSKDPESNGSPQNSDGDASSSASSDGSNVKMLEEKIRNAIRQSLMSLNKSESEEPRRDLDADNAGKQNAEDNSPAEECNDQRVPDANEPLLPPPDLNETLVLQDIEKPKRTKKASNKVPATADSNIFEVGTTSVSNTRSLRKKSLVNYAELEDVKDATGESPDYDDGNAIVDVNEDDAGIVESSSSEAKTSDSSNIDDTKNDSSEIGKDVVENGVSSEDKIIKEDNLKNKDVHESETYILKENLSKNTNNALNKNLNKKRAKLRHRRIGVKNQKSTPITAIESIVESDELPVSVPIISENLSKTTNNVLSKIINKNRAKLRAKKERKLIAKTHKSPVNADIESAVDSKQSPVCEPVVSENMFQIQDNATFLASVAQNADSIEKEPPIKIIINKQKARRKSKNIKKVGLKGHNDLFEDFSLVIKKKRIITFSPPDTFSKEDTYPMEVHHVPKLSVDVVEKEDLNDSVQEMDMELDEIPIQSNIIETPKLDLPQADNFAPDVPREAEQNTSNLEATLPDSSKTGGKKKKGKNKKTGNSLPKREENVIENAINQLEEVNNILKLPLLKITTKLNKCDDVCDKDNEFSSDIYSSNASITSETDNTASDLPEEMLVRTEVVEKDYEEQDPEETSNSGSVQSLKIIKPVIIRRSRKIKKKGMKRKSKNHILTDEAITENTEETEHDKSVSQDLDFTIHAELEDTPADVHSLEVNYSSALTEQEQESQTVEVASTVVEDLEKRVDEKLENVEKETEKQTCGEIRTETIKILDTSFLKPQIKMSKRGKKKGSTKKSRLRILSAEKIQNSTAPETNKEPDEVLTDNEPVLTDNEPNNEDSELELTSDDNASLPLVADPKPCYKIDDISKEDIDKIYAFSETEDFELEKPIELHRRIPRKNESVEKRTEAAQGEILPPKTFTKKKSKTVSKELEKGRNDLNFSGIFKEETPPNVVKPAKRKSQPSKEISVLEPDVKEETETEVPGSRKSMRSAKAKALEHIHDEAIAELTDEIITDKKLVKDTKPAVAAVKKTKNKKKNENVDVDVEKEVLNSEALLHDEALAEFADAEMDVDARILKETKTIDATGRKSKHKKKNDKLVLDADFQEDINNEDLLVDEALVEFTDVENVKEPDAAQDVIKKTKNKKKNEKTVSDFDFTEEEEEEALDDEASADLTDAGAKTVLETKTVDGVKRTKNKKKPEKQLSDFDFTKEVLTSESSFQEEILSELTDMERSTDKIVLEETKIIEDVIKKAKTKKKTEKLVSSFDFHKDVLSSEGPLLEDLVAELDGFEELDNSIERELRAEMPIESEEKNAKMEKSKEEQETTAEDADENQELRRSRRGSRKVTSYNENDLIDPLIDALENKRKSRKKDDKSGGDAKQKKHERKLNSEELFDLLKASTNDNLYVPKQHNSFLTNLDDTSRDVTDDNFDHVFENMLEKSAFLTQEKFIPRHKQDIDKIYEFTESPENVDLTVDEESRLSTVKKSRKLPENIEPMFLTQDSNSESKSKSDKFESNYCEICNKSFVKLENLIKHRRTLTHIQKLSEIEAKEAEKSKIISRHEDENSRESVIEPPSLIESSEKIESADLQTSDTTDEDKDRDMPTSFTTNSSLKLADIISDVLNKPVLTDMDEEPNKFSEIILQNSDTKRYKSLGERKSFDSDTLVTSESHLTESFESNQNHTKILEKQISLLENIIENQTGNNYIDDISLSSEKSDTISEVQTPCVTKPTSDDNSFLKPTQYEEISEDSANLRHYDDPKLRKTLNRDEELFLECCSLLKSSSEVSSSYSNKKMQEKIVGALGLKPVDEVDWMEKKNLDNRDRDDLSDNDYYSDNSGIPTPLGNSYDDDASNSNTISSNWGVDRSIEESQIEDTDARFTFEHIAEKQTEDNDLKFEGLLSSQRSDITQMHRENSNSRKEEFSDNSINDSKKIMTKGARKVFEGLKVSIPTEELNLEEVLNYSPKQKKLESVSDNVVEEEKSLISPTQKSRNSRKSKPVKKAQVGSNLLFKVSKKKLSSPTIPNQEIQKDVYDFEETQDNTDVFTKPDFRAFRTMKTGENESETESRDFADSSKEEPEEPPAANVPATVKKSKAQENITKKKCMIMGRIFKNAAKSKMEDIDEEMRNIPVIDNEELVENYVADCNKQVKPNSESETNTFDEASEEQHIENDQKLKLKSDIKKQDNKKKLKTKGKKRIRTNSDSTDDEFSINKTAKRRTNKKNAKEEDNVINLEQELKECIGVASRKSQRKCTSGKQNVLVEYWSSDDSQFEALLEKQIIEIKPKEKPAEKPLEPPPEEPSETSNEPPPAEEMKKPPEIKKVRKKSVTGRKKLKSQEMTIDGSSVNRRKRAAANPLYHWSSSSEDEANDLIEVKPLRDEIEDDEDRPVQHGWIVGDSPKKLVTMLAQAKGKKVDVDCVKEQGKKRTNTVS